MSGIRRARTSLINKTLVGLAVAVPMLCCPWALSTAGADVGDILANVTVPVPSPSGIGIGIAVDCAYPANLYYTNTGSDLLHTMTATGVHISSTPMTDAATGNPISFGAIAWDNSRQLLWGGTDSSCPVEVYQIDPSTGVATYQFSMLSQTWCFCDGLAYDGIDDTVWVSDDISDDIEHFQADGTYLSTLTPTNAAGGTLGGISGVLVGKGDQLYLGRNGWGEIVQVKKSDGSFIASFATPGGRDEDLECDVVSFPGKTAVWSKDAYDDTVTALEVEAGTCVCGGGGGIGEIKPGTPFTPDPAGNGRAVAYNGAGLLYYTVYPDTNIYQVTTLGVSLGPIANPGRVQCGSLSWDPTTGDLWCGSYDGTSDVYKVDPITGVAISQFNTNVVVGGMNQDSCYGAGGEPYIDGLALDTDGSVWVSGDAARTIYHIDPFTPALLGSFLVPDHRASGVTGCNTGIEVAPGGYLELAMQAGADQGPHDIVKIEKADDVDNPPIVVSFTALFTNNPGVEDISYDPDTYAPRCALWTNEFGASNRLTAFDVQCTRTIGYWKNHSEDTEEFLPIALGDGTDVDVCQVVDDADEAEDVLRGHSGQDFAPRLKAQLLAAKLNLAMGDIPQVDLDAIGPVIDDADALLSRNVCNPDTGKRGADRDEAGNLAHALDAFNNKYAP